MDEVINKLQNLFMKSHILSWDNKLIFSIIYLQGYVGFHKELSASDVLEIINKIYNEEI